MQISSKESGERLQIRRDRVTVYSAHQREARVCENDCALNRVDRDFALLPTEARANDPAVLSYLVLLHPAELCKLRNR